MNACRKDERLMPTRWYKQQNITKGYQLLKLATEWKKHGNILKVLHLGMHLNAQAGL